jgi:hypothetical protein
VTADEAGDESGVRLLKYLPSRGRLPDMAAFHDHHHVGERHRLVLAMRHVQEADPEFPLKALQFAAHMLAQEGIERRQRLIEEEDLRTGDQRSRQRDALLLAARHLPRQALGEAAHLDEVKELARPLAPRGLGHAADLKTVGDVVDGRHVGKERVVLEHHRRTARARRRVGDVAIADQDVS